MILWFCNERYDILIELSRLLLYLVLASSSDVLCATMVLQAAPVASVVTCGVNGRQGGWPGPCTTTPHLHPRPELPLPLSNSHRIAGQKQLQSRDTRLCATREQPPPINPDEPRPPSRRHVQDVNPPHLPPPSLPTQANHPHHQHPHGVAQAKAQVVDPALPPRLAPRHLPPPHPPHRRAPPQEVVARAGQAPRPRQPLRHRRAAALLPARH